MFITPGGKKKTACRPRTLSIVKETQKTLRRRKRTGIWRKKDDNERHLIGTEEREE